MKLQSISKKCGILFLFLCNLSTHSAERKIALSAETAAESKAREDLKDAIMRIDYLQNSAPEGVWDHAWLVLDKLKPKQLSILHQLRNNDLFLKIFVQPVKNHVNDIDGGVDASADEVKAALDANQEAIKDALAAPPHKPAGEGEPGAEAEPGIEAVDEPGSPRPQREEKELKEGKRYEEERKLEVALGEDAGPEEWARMAPLGPEISIPNDLLRIVANPAAVPGIVLNLDEQEILDVSLPNQREQFARQVWNSLDSSIKAEVRKLPSFSAELTRKAHMLFLRTILQEFPVTAEEKYVNAAVDEAVAKFSRVFTSKRRKEEIAPLEKVQPLEALVTNMLDKINDLDYRRTQLADAGTIAPAQNSTLFHAAMLQRLSTMLSKASTDPLERKRLYDLWAEGTRNIDLAYKDLAELVSLTNKGWAALWLVPYFGSYPWSRKYLEDQVKTLQNSAARLDISEIPQRQLAMLPAKTSAEYKEKEEFKTIVAALDKIFNQSFAIIGRPDLGTASALINVLETSLQERRIKAKSQPATDALRAIFADYEHFDGDKAHKVYQKIANPVEDKFIANWGKEGIARWGNAASPETEQLKKRWKELTKSILQSPQKRLYKQAQEYLEELFQKFVRENRFSSAAALSNLIHAASKEQRKISSAQALQEKRPKRPAIVLLNNIVEQIALFDVEYVYEDIFSIEKQLYPYQPNYWTARRLTSAKVEKEWRDTVNIIESEQLLFEPTLITVNLIDSSKDLQKKKRILLRLRAIFNMALRDTKYPYQTRALRLLINLVQSVAEGETSLIMAVKNAVAPQEPTVPEDVRKKVYERHLDEIKQLIALGANPYRKDIHGKNALNYATGNKEIMDLLNKAKPQLQKGADAQKVVEDRLKRLLYNEVSHTDLTTFDSYMRLQEIAGSSWWSRVTAWPFGSDWLREWHKATRYWFNKGNDVDKLLEKPKP